MSTNPKLYVVNNDVNNLSEVGKISAIVPCLFTEDGHSISELWYQKGCPLNISNQRMFQETFDLNLGPGEVRFIRTVFPPLKKILKRAKKENRSINANSYGIHNTTTLDFAVVIKGEIELLTEHGKHRLKERDCVVQQATIHAWQNPTSVETQMMFVMIGVKTPVNFQAKEFNASPVISLQYPPK